MPRSARAAVDGQCYHVINRGNNRARVFHSVADYRRFIELMGAAQSRIALDVFAVCLMPNHFHFLVRTRRGEDLGAWMHWLLTTHVRHHHQRHRSSGRVWQGRFKAFPVQEDLHLLTVMRYIERNALRANLVEHAEQWPWGSRNWRVFATAAFGLSLPLVPLPQNWVAYVNEPQTPAELDRLRTCVNRQQPYGSASWWSKRREYAASRVLCGPWGGPEGKRYRSGNLECPHFSRGCNGVYRCDRLQDRPAGYAYRHRYRQVLREKNVRLNVSEDVIVEEPSGRIIATNRDYYFSWRLSKYLDMSGGGGTIQASYLNPPTVKLLSPK